MSWTDAVLQKMMSSHDPGSRCSAADAVGKLYVEEVSFWDHLTYSNSQIDCLMYVSMLKHKAMLPG